MPRTITNYCAADNIWLTISKQAGVEITAAMLTSGAGARWSGVFTEFPTLGTTLHTRQVWVKVSLKWGLQAAATIRHYPHIVILMTITPPLVAGGEAGQVAGGAGNN